jgi:hypothetical protein
VRLTDGTVRYRKSDLDKWIKTRVWGSARSEEQANAS